MILIVSNHNIYGKGDNSKRILNENTLHGGEPVFNDNNGTNFSLFALYAHFQYGGGKPLTIAMSSIDFSNTNQKELGIDNMEPGDIRGVNLFNAGALSPAALAFGRVNMEYHGNDQFSIVGGDESSKFDFTPIIDSNASNGRNAGNIVGIAVNYNVFLSLMAGSPSPTLIPLLFGGPFYVYFNGTAHITK